MAELSILIRIGCRSPDVTNVTSSTSLDEGIGNETMKHFPQTLEGSWSVGSKSLRDVLNRIWVQFVTLSENLLHHILRRYILRVFQDKGLFKFSKRFYLLPQLQCKSSGQIRTGLICFTTPAWLLFFVNIHEW